MIKREQFTFYRSYYEAVAELSEEERSRYLLAVIVYALDGEMIELQTPVLRGFFRLTKPVLDAARKKAVSGRAGGSKPKAKRKQKASKKEKEEEVEVEIENEIEIEIESEDECLLRESGFLRFWKEYPVKIGKKQARTVWMDMKPEERKVLDSLKLWKQSRQWLRENGRFIPRAAKWLTERHFDQVPDCGVPKGASGVLGQAEIEAIEQMMGGHYEDV